MWSYEHYDKWSDSQQLSTDSLLNRLDCRRADLDQSLDKLYLALGQYRRRPSFLRQLKVGSAISFSSEALADYLTSEFTGQSVISEDSRQLAVNTIVYCGEERRSLINMLFIEPVVEIRDAELVRQELEGGGPNQFDPGAYCLRATGLYYDLAQQDFRQLKKAV